MASAVPSPSGRQTRADYVFRLNRVERFTCEAKKPAELLNDRHIYQAKRDALLAAWHDTGSAHALHPVSALRQLDGPRAPQLHLWWYPE